VRGFGGTRYYSSSSVVVVMPPAGVGVGVHVLLLLVLMIAWCLDLERVLLSYQKRILRDRMRRRLFRASSC